MLIINKIEVNRELPLYNSCGEVIKLCEKSIFNILYDNNKITSEMAEKILKNRLNNVYDKKSIPYMNYIIIVTEEQFNNLLEGRLKNKNE